MPLPEVVVYSKPACCLCEKVKEQLVKLRQKHEFAWREINILEDAAAYQNYKNEIPVIFVNGKKSFKYHLNEKELIRLLKAASRAAHQDSASTNHSRR